MADLVFKNIPEEGFDAQTGFNRLSNPKPSRISRVISQDETPAPVSENRLSNPSAKSEGSSTDFQEESPKLSVSALSQKTEPAKTSAISLSESFSRASNPRPTRRNRNQISSGTSEIPEFSNSPVTAEDCDSRASNPAQTRRNRNQISSGTSEIPEFSNSPVTAEDCNSHISSPTQTRPKRELSFAIPESASNASPSESVEKESLSETSDSALAKKSETVSAAPNEKKPLLTFFSVANPYGVKCEEDSSISDAARTGELFSSDVTSENNNNNGRASNITSSSRK